MILTKNSNGEWVQVAGNGKAEYGASTVRSGTITTDEIGIGGFAEFTVTFDTPMPDDDYNITWDWNLAGGNLTFAIVSVTEKTKNGFKIYVRNSDTTANPLTSHILSWYAFKFYTDTEYNSLLEDVAKLTGVTSGTGIRNTSYVSSTSFAAEWYKIGRICTVNLQYNLSQLTPSSVEIITGLPKPICEITCVGEGASNTAETGFVIMKNGAVRTHYEGAEGQFMHGTATYITAE